MKRDNSQSSDDERETKKQKTDVGISVAMETVIDNINHHPITGEDAIKNLKSWIADCDVRIMVRADNGENVTYCFGNMMLNIYIECGEQKHLPPRARHPSHQQPCRNHNQPCY